MRKLKENDEINEPPKEFINRIIQGDCIQILREKFPDNCIDMVFVDPPRKIEVMKEEKPREKKEEKKGEEK
jgi:DNA modification methylase